jgi:ferrous iron transport protein A
LRIPQISFDKLGFSTGEFVNKASQRQPLLITARINFLKRAIVTLDQLPLNQPAHVESINWALLGEAGARRLRALGFDTGVKVEALHYGGVIAKDPIAVRVGRMTVALRKAQAAAVELA